MWSDPYRLRASYYRKEEEATSGGKQRLQLKIRASKLLQQQLFSELDSMKRKMELKVLLSGLHVD